MLGRFRVIDRMLSTPREAIYRVFDPQLRGQDDGTCLLRHLGEAEMLDAVRPDEYRQRFGAARDLAHPNVAATCEVLDVNGRPAVVQEWLHGLPGGEWPAAVGSPGVWHRLLMQAALGLHAAHSAGLTHGRLTADSFVLTRPGVVKLSGIGEPPWLHPGGADRDASPEEDLRLLGQVAHGWMHAGARRRAVRPKPFPAGLLGVLRSLGVSHADGAVPMGVYPSTAALLEDLDRVSSEVPADQGAWDKLLAYVAENAGDGIVLRQSA
jgi:trichohyalin